MGHDEGVAGRVKGQVKHLQLMKIVFGAAHFHAYFQLVVAVGVGHSQQPLPEGCRRQRLQSLQVDQGEEH